MQILSCLWVCFVVLIAGLIAGLTFNASYADTLPALKTVPSVDLNRYAGNWYEIALIPNRFQRMCVKDSQARYTPLPTQGKGAATVMVDNFCCTQKNGRTKHVLGRAKVTDPQSQAKLSVTFLNLLGWRYWFGENYHIIDLAPDYSYAVVGYPSRQYGWLLARTPALPVETLKTIAVRLKAQGYNPCLWQVSPQSAGMMQRQRLCDI